MPVESHAVFSLPVSATLRDLDSDITTYVSDNHTCLAVIHRAADSQVCGYDSESVLEYLF